MRPAWTATQNSRDGPQSWTEPGAAIGAGAGLAGGYLYGKHEEATQNAYQRGLQDGSRQAQVHSGSR